MLLQLYLAAFVSAAPIDGIAPRDIILPASTIVTSVDCGDWEAWVEKGNRVWRANDHVSIQTDTAARVVGSGDVRWDKAPELYGQIEMQCGPEIGAGIGNPFAGEPIQTSTQ